jgi:hypothetical protein
MKVADNTVYAFIIAMLMLVLVSTSSHAGSNLEDLRWEIPRGPAQSPKPAGNTNEKNGAIAYNSGTGAVGWSYEFRTAGEADSYAINKCGAGCTVVVRVSGSSCGAYATSDNGATGWATSAYMSEAINNAIGYCQQGGGVNCQERAHTCNSGYR